MNVGRQASKEGSESHRPLKTRKRVTKIDEASRQDIGEISIYPGGKALSPFMDLGPREARLGGWRETTLPLCGGFMAGRQIDEA